MSDKMFPIPIEKLADWILKEYAQQKTIFGILSHKFYQCKQERNESIFNESLDTLVGPAAGPHTQLAQNIISSYLTGGRFFELKTVQKLDDLKIDKPCIDASDEGYNVEWSQELSLDKSYGEYIKAWILIHLVKDLFILSQSERGFVFNMSVGYDLEGIKTDRMNKFIEELKDASNNEQFANYKSYIVNYLVSNSTREFLSKEFNISENRMGEIVNAMIRITPFISNSVTLSTMHGCPPNEIEAIASYLIEEKNLNTYVKLNPTLLGYDFVSDTLHKLGYKYINLDSHSFDNDLKYSDALPMLKRLTETAQKKQLQFGVKLSNTLGVKNFLKTLPGNDMYMSGRSLFPLTINLAYKLSEEFNGKLNISYSGGASNNNIKDILETGIKPVTFATDLLKPGGYTRLAQIANSAMGASKTEIGKINLTLLKKLAEDSLTNKAYSKEKREIKSIKIQLSLPAFDCYIAPCQQACPIHQDVASYIKLVEQKKYEEAYELIIQKNPLPHITGYICDHQCMNHCTRWDYDEPVLIRALKKIAAENGYSSYLEKFNNEFLKNQNHIKTAIIGAGPSGLSAGYFLAKAGFDVTIFEKEMNAGGIVQNILPKFRLPKEAIEKDIQFIEKHGIKFVFGFDPVFSVEKLKKEGFKYIFIAMGAGLSNKSHLEGDSVLEAIALLKDYHNAQLFDLGKTVAVIGGGNSAMDSARAALRYDGVEKTYLIYRRTIEEMLADKEEFFAALDEGVEFKELLLPVKFQEGILTCQKMKLGQIGKDGRKEVEPIEGEFINITVDSVISAIGEHVNKESLHMNKIRMAHNRAVVNEWNETEIPNVFIGGDALRGPSTVIESIADGKKTAEAIIKKEHLEYLSIPAKKYFVDDPLLFEDIDNRKGNIVYQSPQDIISEANRCLGCNFICNKCEEVCPNRANIAVIEDSKFFKDKFQILHIDSMCNECGNCETFCPYQGAPYKEKPTLFDNEHDFRLSRNNGFFLIREENQIIANIRWKSERGTITFDNMHEVIKSSYFDQKEIESLTQLIKNLLKNYFYLLSFTDV